MKAKTPALRLTSVEVQAALERLVAKQGYAVIGQPPYAAIKFKIGDKYSFFCNFPLLDKYLRVYSRAKFEDWRKQCLWLGKNNPSWPKMRIPSPEKGARFFKVRLISEPAGG